MDVQMLNRAVTERRPVRGTHIFCGAPPLTEAIAQTGFDVLWIDMEHTGIGIESLQNNLIAARAGGTPAWVRIPWNDPVLAKPVLDMGADGIIFPFVRTAEEAKRAAAACEFPPGGVRGYGPLRALDYGRIPQREYVTETYRRCLRIVQIEHIDAVRNLREIASTDGIDAFIVGPNDLSGSVGKLGLVKDPELTTLYGEIGTVLTEVKKPFCVATGCDPEFLRLLRSVVTTIFFAGNDVGYVYEGALAARRMLEEIQ